MSDIVKQLRKIQVSAPPDYPVHPGICDEAADEIERLRTENEQLRTNNLRLQKQIIEFENVEGGGDEWEKDEWRVTIGEDGVVRNRRGQQMQFCTHCGAWFSCVNWCPECGPYKAQRPLTKHDVENADGGGDE